MSYSNKQFLDCIKAMVISDAKRSDILASVTAAQALIESGSGNSLLTQKANNLFGIKGEYNGQSVTMKTQEYMNGQYVTVSAKFRKYPSWQESIIDHNNFLLKNSRYKNLIGVKGYKRVCELLQQDGYATSPTYGQTLINTIEKLQLYAWDVREPFVPYAGVVTASWLKVREGASTNYPVVKNRENEEYKLEEGLCIAIYDEVNEWCKIAPTKNRWVSKRYISKE